jgi:site-specific recombinase XerD
MTSPVGRRASAANRLLDEFETWVVREGPQVSSYTAQRYRRYAEQFATEQGNPQSVGRQQVEAWRGTITQVRGPTGVREANVSTVNLKLAALKSFFDFCVAKGYRGDNPMAGLSLMPVPKRLPRPIEREQLDKLFEVLCAAPESDTTLQDRAIIETLFASGLRREEAGTLTLGSIRDRYTLRVVGKGDKERETVLTEPAYDALRTWVLKQHGDVRSEKLRVEINADAAFDDLRNRKPQAALFFGGDGKPLTEAADPGHYIWKRAAHWFQEAGIDATTHQLRHSFATHLLDGGADIRAVQDLMGHGDIRTTIGYTKTLRSARLRALQAHPRAHR